MRNLERKLSEITPLLILRIKFFTLKKYICKHLILDMIMNYLRDRYLLFPGPHRGLANHKFTPFHVSQFRIFGNLINHLLEGTSRTRLSQLQTGSHES